MPGWKEFKGGAALCTLGAGIDASIVSIPIVGVIGGWPTGVNPFPVTIDKGLVNEERVLCSGITPTTGGATLTVSQRGFDGTSASSHDLGARVVHGFDADSASTLMSHAFDATRDDHTQYIPAAGTRGFTGVSAISGAITAVGTTSSNGSGSLLALSNHVHVIGVGAISNANQFGALVVPSSAIASNAVTTNKIADANVTIGKFDPAILPLEQVVANNVTWTRKVVDSDLFSQTVGPFTYATRQVVSLQLYVNPEEAAGATPWDAAVQVRTASGGGGTLLGEQSFRNPGTNLRLPLNVNCNQLDVAANATTTYWVWVHYQTGTPTAGGGFTPSTLSSNVMRTRVIRAGA